VADAQKHIDQLDAGEILKGTYRIGKMLGEGGAGMVYQAEHTSLGHLVAIKTLVSKLARNPDTRGRFLEEGIIQANLVHPNIVRVTDTINEGGVTAIVMEYVDGPSLDHYLRRLDRLLSEEEACQIICAVLDAMALAHAEGVVHRDLKPANIMMARVGGGTQPRVTDFGIAKLLSSQGRTATGTTMGTLYYISPEQLASAKTVDGRADIYSLGCTLFEMLTLQPPFPLDTDFALMMAHLHEPAPDPRTVRPELSEEVAKVVMKAMAKDPDQRFKSCTEMRELLLLTLDNGRTPALRRGIAAAPQVGPSTAPNWRSPEMTQGGGEAANTQSPEAPVSPGGETVEMRLRNDATVGPRVSRRLAPAAPPMGRVTTVPVAEPASPKVQRAVWAVIAAGALALLGVVWAGRRAEEPAPAAVAPAEQTVGAGTPAPAAVAPPVEVEVDLKLCRAAVDRWKEEMALPQAAELDSVMLSLNALSERCPPLLRKQAAGVRFDSQLAELGADLLKAMQFYGRGRVALRDGSDPCTDATMTATQVARSLDRLKEAFGSALLLEYERAILEPRQQELTAFAARLREEFPACSLPALPEAAAVEAPANPPAPAGSGQP
jgi:hypothetical protein